MPVARVKKKSVLPSNVERAAEIFSEYGDFILTVIHYHASNQAQADDLFQDFFLSLVSRPIPQNIRNIKSYLYKAISNDIVDATRRAEKYQARIRKYADCLNFSVNKNTPRNALMEEEEIGRMFKLIEGCLPRSEAKAIILRYKHNHNIKDIARKMHVNDRSIRKYIFRGLSKLRQFWTVNSKTR